MAATSKPVQDAKMVAEDAVVPLLGVLDRAVLEAREEKRLAPDRSMG